MVGLRAGTRRHVFPLARFVDGRPLDGLDQGLAVIDSPRTAWLRLIEPHPSLKGGTPLSQPSRGETAQVAELAARDFGQP